MLLDHRDEYPSQWTAIRSIDGKFDMSPETLRARLRQHEHDNGTRPELTTEERAQLKELDARETFELRQANDPQVRSGFLRGGARPPTETMIAYIDEHKER